MLFQIGNRELVSTQQPDIFAISMEESMHHLMQEMLFLKVFQDFKQGRISFISSMGQTHQDRGYTYFLGGGSRMEDLYIFFMWKNSE